MSAKTNPGDERKVKTSSHHGTVDSESMRQPNTGGRDKAESELEPAGLTVDDVAKQSAYESDENDISHMAANSDRNEKAP